MLPFESAFLVMQICYGALKQYPYLHVPEESNPVKNSTSSSLLSNSMMGREVSSIPGSMAFNPGNISQTDVGMGELSGRIAETG